MGILKDQISSQYGLKGDTPDNRPGASALNDIHYSTKTKEHVGGHTQLSLGGKPVKYTDNLPE